MKFVIIISHVISHKLNIVCESFENFDHLHVTNEFFYSIDHKYVTNLIFLDKHLLSNGR